MRSAGDRTAIVAASRLVAGCEINYAGAGYRESGGQIDELFLPARPGGGRAVPAPIVIATRDPAPSPWRAASSGRAVCRPSEQSLEVMRKVVDALQHVDVDRRARQDRHHRAVAIAADSFRPGAADRRRRGHRRSPRHARIWCGLASPSAWAAARVSGLLAAQRGRSADVQAVPPPSRRGCRRPSCPRAHVQSVRPGVRVRRAVRAASLDAPMAAPRREHRRSFPRRCRACSCSRSMSRLDPRRSRPRRRSVRTTTSSRFCAASSRISPSIACTRSWRVLTDRSRSRSAQTIRSPTAVVDARGEAGVALVKEVLLDDRLARVRAEDGPLRQRR